MKFNIKNFYNNIENSENTITNVDIYKNSFFNFKVIEDNNKFVDSNYTFLNDNLIPLNINYYDNNPDPTKKSLYTIINSLNINKLGSPDVTIFRISAGQIKYEEKNDNSNINNINTNETVNPLILKYKNEEIKITENDEVVSGGIKTSFLFLEDHSKIHDNLTIPELDFITDTTIGLGGLFVDTIDYTTNKSLFSDSFSSLDNYITTSDAMIQYKPDGGSTIKSTLSYTEGDGYTLSALNIKESEDSFCFFDVDNYITIFSEQESGSAGFEVFEPGSSESKKFLGDTEGLTKGIIKVYCNKLVEEATT